MGTKDNGVPSKLYLNISQPPEKRRKVQVAAKCKRLLMEHGALAADVEVEYATGEVWLKGTRVAAATAAITPPHTTQTGTQGWIDLPAIAAKLHRRCSHGVAAPRLWECCSCLSPSPLKLGSRTLLTKTVTIHEHIRGSRPKLGSLFIAWPK